MSAARLLVVLVLLAPLAFARNPGDPAGPKVYSNVHAAQPNDLIGDELILVILGYHVSATLNEFQGGRYPTQRVLRGTLLSGRLRLYGKHEYGKIRILGALVGAQLTVAITDRKVGQAPATRQAQLHLVKRCVYSTCAGPPE